MQTETKHVEFTQVNVDRCQCTNCPVQTPSSCVADKVRAMAGKDLGSMSAQDVPKVYCSQGTASCGDLDFTPNCICPTCTVWQENGLANYKYCRNGSAEVQG